MNDLSRFLNRAKYNINYYLQKLPRITRILLLSTLIIFILQQFIDLSIFKLHPLNNGFYPWQLVTYAFLHADFNHFFFNALALWIFGSPIEHYWKQKRFITFVLVCIIAGALMSLIAYSNFNLIGISGLVFGLLIAYGMMWPESTIMLLIPPVPIKAKYFVMIYAGLMLLMIFSSRNDGIAHFAHLGGAIGGFLLIQYWRKKPPFHKF
jgi:membrane associated rhomboid family serine protease